MLGQRKKVVQRAGTIREHLGGEKLGLHLQEGASAGKGEGSRLNRQNDVLPGKRMNSFGQKQFLFPLKFIFPS